MHGTTIKISSPYSLKIVTTNFTRSRTWTDISVQEKQWEKDLRFGRVWLRMRTDGWHW